VFVIGLVEGECGVIDASPHSKAESEDENLVRPAVLEEAGEEAPSSFCYLLRVPN